MLNIGKCGSENFHDLSRCHSFKCQRQDCSDFYSLDYLGTQDGEGAHWEGWPGEAS